MTEPQNRWRRDVLVGLVKNVSQYQINRERGFYHMPAALLACPPEQVRWIALYRSQRLFGSSGAGILDVGEVSGCYKLARREITEIPAGRNGDELYYRFAISAWSPPVQPIAARGIAPGMSMLTTRFLLDHCRYMPELYISGEAHWQLYSMLRDAAIRTQNGGSEPLPAPAGFTAMISGWAIGVYTPDGNYQQFDLRDFFFEPYSFLRRVEPYVIPQDGGDNYHVY